MAETPRRDRACCCLVLVLVPMFKIAAIAVAIAATIAVAAHCCYCYQVALGSLRRETLRPQRADIAGAIASSGPQYHESSNPNQSDSLVNYFMAIVCLFVNSQCDDLMCRTPCLFS
jgi:hypothetical protein